jgi:hypothetical protein
MVEYWTLAHLSSHFLRAFALPGKSASPPAAFLSFLAMSLFPLV